MAEPDDSVPQFGINAYQPRAPFIELHNRPQRWAILVCHRRAGKTVACVAELVLSALFTPKKDARYAYVAPQYGQAKDIAWMYVKRLTADIPGVIYNESELRADLPNGNRIRLYGADNPDRLRGLYLDGVILDEYADMRPSVWGEILRPMLTDRKGWAVFIGTPKGHNEFYSKWTGADDDWFKLMLKASDSGIVDALELADARKGMTEDQYEQEFECSFEAAITGAYFGKELRQAEEDGRITRVPHDPMLKTHTAWDLGMADSMTIWFFQAVGKEIRVIDYYEASGYGLDHYVKELSRKPYLYGKHYAPHDIKVRELGTGKSRWEVAKSLGVTFDVVKQMEVADGINAARMTIPRMYFDKQKTATGVDALKQYREKIDEKRQVSMGPLHDWCFTGDTEILTRHGTCQIMNLPLHGEVLTSCGWKPYANPRVTRRGAQLVRVQFASGYSVRCTPDHSFKTASGWTSAESLTSTSLIQSSLTRSRSTSMAVSTACGRVSDTFRAAARSCIATFGPWRLVTFPKVATFTIATATRSITGSTTSNASRQRSIFPKLGPRTKASRDTRTSRPWLATRPLSGTPLLRDVCGTAETLSDPRAGQSGSVSRFHASFAGRYLTALSVRVATLRSFVPRSAKPLRIESVERLDAVSDVWCISVPGSEEFSLANGALVHNCSHAADAFRYLCIGYREEQPSLRQDQGEVTNFNGDGWMN